MKIQLEAFTPDPNSSFRLLLNPRLSAVFFWHFHPELELVFIDGASGRRHIGKHISKYEGSDLVFIGSNIPHLNFDYGVKTDYEKVVLHIRPDFMSQSIANLPELQGIKQLFSDAQFGIAYGEKTKNLIGKRLKKLHQFPPFELFLEILDILNYLSKAEDATLLHQQKVENQYTQKDQDRLKAIYGFIDESYHRKIEIDEVAAISCLTNAAFCRYFKKMTRLTFTNFLNQYRINEAKRLLLLDKNVSETCYECGFESLSYFNRTFKKVTGENPLAFKRNLK